MSAPVRPFLIAGGATAEDDAPEWEGYVWHCVPRSRIDFCHLKDDVWRARVDPKMLDEFVELVGCHDGVLCETPDALLLVTEWARRGTVPRPVLALEVDGLRPARAIAAWYEATHGSDPLPALLEAPCVSWIATSEEQAGRLEAEGVRPAFLHRVPTSASLFSMLSRRAGALLADRFRQGDPVAPTAGAVLFPGNGRRDWDAVVDAVLALGELPCFVLGGSRYDLERRFAVRRARWPSHLRHIESVRLERYIELVRAAKLVVVPLLPGRGDGGHSTIAIAHRLGVPLVCTDAPAVAEYVGGGAARLCVPGETRSLADAIRAVWSDAELARSVAERGREAERERDERFGRALVGAIERARDATTKSRGPFA